MQRYLYHMTVLTSAVTAEHYTSWLNAGLLCGDWGRLRLPRPLREIWQERFPELEPGQSADRAAYFSRAELIAACRAALDEDFSLETLRDQLAFAAAYPDEAFSRYGAGPDLIAEVKAWALNWSTEIGLGIAESESWSDDENDSD